MRGFGGSGVRGFGGSGVRGFCADGQQLPTKSREPAALTNEGGQLSEGGGRQPLTVAPVAAFEQGKTIGETVDDGDVTGGELLGLTTGDSLGFCLGDMVNDTVLFWVPPNDSAGVDASGGIIGVAVTDDDAVIGAFGVLIVKLMISHIDYLLSEYSILYLQI